MDIGQCVKLRAQAAIGAYTHIRYRSISINCGVKPDLSTDEYSQPGSQATMPNVCNNPKVCILVVLESAAAVVCITRQTPPLILLRELVLAMIFGMSGGCLGRKSHIMPHSYH